MEVLQRTSQVPYALPLFTKLDGGCAIHPIEDGKEKSKRRRGNRGGRSRKNKNNTDEEKRFDPNKNTMRTWTEFMMDYAVGADFELADKLWEEAGSNTTEESDSDQPPELLPY